jgi:acyl dehydratase
MCNHLLCFTSLRYYALFGEIPMSLQSTLADLQSKVGTETHASDWLAIGQERIQQFAEATGDHPWIHVDVERANAQSPFGGPIAHGFLTLSLIPYLTGGVDPDKPEYPEAKMGVNYGLNKVRFPCPVRVGSRIRTRTTLLSAEEVKGNGIQIVRQVMIEIDGEAKPACVAETVTRLYF